VFAPLTGPCPVKPCQSQPSGFGGRVNPRHSRVATKPSSIQRPDLRTGLAGIKASPRRGTDKAVANTAARTLRASRFRHGDAMERSEDDPRRQQTFSPATPGQQPAELECVDDEFFPAFTTPVIPAGGAGQVQAKRAPVAAGPGADCI